MNQYSFFTFFPYLKKRFVDKAVLKINTALKNRDFQLASDLLAQANYTYRISDDKLTLLSLGLIKDSEVIKTEEYIALKRELKILK